MKIYAKTDIGKVRETNQDCYYIPISEEELKLYIIADGMGGYAGGEVASNLAVFTAKNYILENIEGEEKPEGIREIINSAFDETNKIIYAKAKHSEELEEMGTTLDICLIYNNIIYIGHIGDSRIYKISNGDIEQLTTDHSYVQKLVKEGTITPEEAKSHPKKNMLMKAIGGKEKEEPDIIIETLENDECILMCTDGLVNMLEDEEILNIIQNHPENAHEKLVEMANVSGGIDNITLIIIKNN